MTQELTNEHAAAVEQMCRAICAAFGENPDEQVSRPGFNSTERTEPRWREHMGLCRLEYLRSIALTALAKRPAPSISASGDGQTMALARAAARRCKDLIDTLHELDGTPASAAGFHHRDLGTAREHVEAVMEIVERFVATKADTEKGD